MERIRRFADLGFRPVSLRDLSKICPSGTDLSRVATIWNVLNKNSIYLIASATFYDPFNDGLRVAAEADMNALLKITFSDSGAYFVGWRSFYQMQRRGFARRNANSVKHNPDLLGLELDLTDSSRGFGAKVGPKRNYFEYDTSPAWENALRVIEGN